MTAASRSATEVKYGEVESGDLFVYPNGTSVLVISVVPPPGSVLINALITVKVIVVTQKSFTTQKRVGGRDTIFSSSAERFKRKHGADSGGEGPAS